MAAKIMIGAAVAIMVLLAIGEESSASVIHKTIESDDGDTIDCVAISLEIQQPTRSMKDIVADSDIAVAAEEWPQTWHEGGAECPSGTVPIRRSPAANAMNTTAIAGNRVPPPSGDLPGTVEKAAAYGTNGPYHGIRAEVPVWRVDVHHPDEFSMNYVMVGYTLDLSWTPGVGADPPSSLPNQIMAGVMDFWALNNFGPCAAAQVALPWARPCSRPRLFVYYTNDSGVHHNCFNTECGGFQVTNTKYRLGTAWTGESFLGGHQYGVYIGIHRDDTKLIWWVSVMDVDIGYYHDSVFDTRFPEGHYVEMGGRVLNTRQGGKHTTTPMGSSMPECASTLYAASIKEYLGVSALGQLFLDDVGRNVATVPSCYGVRHVGFQKKRPGYQTAYGGAGGIYCDQ